MSDKVKPSNIMDVASVSLIEEDVEVNTKLELKTATSWRAPATITADTFYVEFKVEAGKQGGSWTCPICFTSQKNTARMYEHAYEKHGAVKGVLDMVEKSVDSKCKGANRLQR